MNPQSCHNSWPVFSFQLAALQCRLLFRITYATKAGWLPSRCRYLCVYLCLSLCFSLAVWNSCMLESLAVVAICPGLAFLCFSSHWNCMSLSANMQAISCYSNIHNIAGIYCIVSTHSTGLVCDIILHDFLP